MISNLKFYAEWILMSLIVAVMSLVTGLLIGLEFIFSNPASPITAFVGGFTLGFFGG